MIRWGGRLWSVKRIYEDVKDLIGWTPMVRIKRFALPEGVSLFAKLEYFNPGGSVKDRVGLAFIREAEKSGKLKPGGTIIERSEERRVGKGRGSRVARYERKKR